MLLTKDYTMYRLLAFYSLIACGPVDLADKNSDVQNPPIEEADETEQSEESDDNNGLTPLGDTATSSDTAKPDDDYDDYDDTGKPEDSSEYQDCGPNFDPTDSCTGDWTTTLCIHESLIWWCQDGQWVSEEDKPD